MRTGAPTVYRAVARPSSSSASRIAASAASQAPRTSLASCWSRRAAPLSLSASRRPVATTTCHAASTSAVVSSSAAAAASASAGARASPANRAVASSAQRLRSAAARSSGATRAAAASSSRGASRTGGIRGRSARPPPPGARSSPPSVPADTVLADTLLEGTLVGGTVPGGTVPAATVSTSLDRSSRWPGLPVLSGLTPRSCWPDSASRAAAARPPLSCPLPPWPPPRFPPLPCPARAELRGAASPRRPEAESPPPGVTRPAWRAVAVPGAGFPS